MYLKLLFYGLLIWLFYYGVKNIVITFFTKRQVVVYNFEAIEECFWALFCIFLAGVIVCLAVWLVSNEVMPFKYGFVMAVVGISFAIYASERWPYFFKF